MISEGSCDTEDWSNDAEYSALITEINYILTHNRIENSYFLIPIFHYFSVFTVFKNKYINIFYLKKKKKKYSLGE